MWTFAFKTFWWKIRLLGKIEVGQTVAYGGERESIPTILTSNHPVRQKDSGAVSRATGRSAEVLRARGGVGVEVGAAGHVWLSHIYIRMRAV